MSRRKEFGDFQTPPELADRVLQLVGNNYQSVVEPTCGDGAFLEAAAKYFPLETPLFGVDIDEEHLKNARRSVPRANLSQADFFALDWREYFAKLPEPILIAGNPPWVTNADQGKRGAKNLPKKSNFQKRRGLDALTGRANFDLSEFIIFELLQALTGKRATIAVLIKTSTARRVLAHAFANDLPISETHLYAIDAAKWFGVSASATLFLTHLSDRSVKRAFVHSSFEAPPNIRELGYSEGLLVADASTFERTKHLATNEKKRSPWRSGIKHDAAAVMELELEGGVLTNGLQERCELEDERLFPLLKSTDLAHAEHAAKERRLLLPQLSVGEDTEALRDRLPKTFNYLLAHAEILDRRKSSIYRTRPRFSIFGVGDYTFSPWKVAISGLHKTLEFRVIGPREGRPVVFDDTCYFLPCATEEEANATLAVLQSAPVQELYASMIFWDAKRPITAEVLRRLDLAAAKDYAHRP